MNYLTKKWRNKKIRLYSWKINTTAFVRKCTRM